MQVQSDKLDAEKEWGHIGLTIAVRQIYMDPYFLAFGTHLPKKGHMQSVI